MCVALLQLVVGRGDGWNGPDAPRRRPPRLHGAPAPMQQHGPYVHFGALKECLVEAGIWHRVREIEFFCDRWAGPVSHLERV